MAHDMLRGYAPYTHTFDNKPPGIYLLFAVALTIFGETPRALRIASCVAIAAGAYAMYKLTTSATGGRRNMAFIAAWGYVLFTSHLSGLEANTEIFFMPLVAGGLALVWPVKGRAENGSWARYATAGLLLGLGMCIKESVIYDVIAALVAIGLFSSRELILRNVSIFIAGIAFPISLVPLWFSITGHLDDLYRSSIEANIRRAGLGFSTRENFARFLRALVTLFPLLELALLSPLYLRFAAPKDTVLGRAVLISLLWFTIDSLGALSLGVYESHWILPLIEPLLVLGSIVLVGGIDRLCEGRAMRRRVVGISLAAIAAFQVAKPLYLAYEIVAHRESSDPKYEDRVGTIVEYLRGRVGSADCVFIVSPESAFEYALSGATIPTRYGFSYFLTNQYGLRISAVNVSREVRAIFRCPPRIVVLQVPSTRLDLEPHFYSIAGFATGSTLDRGDVRPDLFVPWFRVIDLARREMGKQYGEPKSVGGALIFERKEPLNADTPSPRAWAGKPNPSTPVPARLSRFRDPRNCYQ